MQQFCPDLHKADARHLLPAAGRQEAARLDGSILIWILCIFPLHFLHDDAIMFNITNNFIKLNKEERI